VWAKDNRLFHPKTSPLDAQVLTDLKISIEETFFIHRPMDRVKVVGSWMGETQSELWPFKPLVAGSSPAALIEKDP